MTDLRDLTLPLDGELGDLIVATWLRQHIAWTQMDEGSEDNAADLAALRRVLKYVTGVDA